MKFEHRRSRIERRLRLAGDWKPRTADRAENAIFDRCFELAEAARELERVADAPGSFGAVAASMGCATSAFGSVADAMLKMRGSVLREIADEDAERDSGEIEQIGRLLFAIDQNMRFAAHAADLAREAASGLEGEAEQAAGAIG